MTYIETYRGTVFAWELDHVGHFTVAYWLGRFEDAGHAMLDALGIGAEARGPGAGVTVDCYIRYHRELRAGDLLHAESGVIEADDTELLLGHRVLESTTGAVCATVEQRVRHVEPVTGRPVPLTAPQRQAADAHRVAWDGPPRERRPQPRGLEGFVDAARDTVKPWEVGVLGRSVLTHYIHRFSASGGHVLAAFGMTPAYMREQHRGLSTFEFQLAIAGDLRPGALVRVRSALLHVGTSSIRLFHAMADARTGRPLATLDQFGVHLDTQARRPAPLPDALRERAKALLAPTVDS